MDSDWKSQLTVPGIAMADAKAKALLDHVAKTGHLTSEKQTALDILAAKQLIATMAMKIAWVPTCRQIAVSLPKYMIDYDGIFW